MYSPSAEVRGHGPGQEVLQIGKKERADRCDRTRGAVRDPTEFSDGHDTGIYSWDLLYDYGERQQAMWQQYLKRLADAGGSVRTMTGDPVPTMKRPPISVSIRSRKTRKRAA